MDIIKLLPENVANKIAAGEVVQRPASAVKEFLENSVDAGAKLIQLVIKDAGKTLVMVIDDGTGMSVTDARMAFERHATSKIRVVEDLFTLHTKGFRGEALASVAAVAQVEVTTRKEDSEVGTFIRIEGNKVMEQSACVSPKGTSISMKNLFFNIPARRNFLKSDVVETRHIIDEFHRVALAHPEIKFVFINNSEEIFNLPATTLRQRIVHIFGRKMDERLVPLKEDMVSLKISGYVCRPSGRKKNSGLQFFIVNNRFVKSRNLHHAVVSAYEGLLKDGQQPEYFIYFEIDPKEIDINIHPTKTEIKFEDERSVYTLLRSSVKHSLGMFNVKETIDFSLDASMEVPYEYKDKVAETPQISVDSNFNPFKENNGGGSVSFKIPSYINKSGASWEGIYSGLKDEVFDAMSDESEPKLFESKINAKDVDLPFFIFGNKYAVTNMGDRVSFININRAHERVIYEKFSKEIKEGNKGIQKLLFPVEIELDVHKVVVFSQMYEDMKKIGFEFENKGNTVCFLGIPSFLESNNVEEVINELIDREEGEGYEQDYISKKMAKAMAVKTMMGKSKEMVEEILRGLLQCEEQIVSPRGKRIYFSFLTRDIDNKIN